MSTDYSTEGVTFQTLNPKEFINLMLTANLAKDREEAIARAVFNGKPVLNRRSWDRLCYQNPDKVSDGTAIKLSLVFNALMARNQQAV